MNNFTIDAMNSLKPSERKNIIALLDSILHRMEASMARVKFNQHQCRYVYMQVRSLCSTLRQLMEPTPTLSIVTVLRAAVYLLDQMGDGNVNVTAPSASHSSCSNETSGEVFFEEDREVFPSVSDFETGHRGTAADHVVDRWKHLLLDRFTCESYFRGWDERFCAAWNLHSSTKKASERKLALQRDEEENAALLLQLYRPTLEALQKRQRRFTWMATPSLAPTAWSSTIATAATREQIIEFYRQRCYAGAWKVMYEDLDRVTRVMMTASGRAAVSPESTLSVRAEDQRDDLIMWRADESIYSELRGVHFTLRHGFYWHEIPVTLQELESPHLIGAFQPDTLSFFVQDAVMRCKWAFPGLVRYWGAFTEKLCTADEEKQAPEIAVERWRVDHPDNTGENETVVYPVAFSPTALQSVGAPTSSTTSSVTGGRRRARRPTPTEPRVCMGFIREALGDGHSLSSCQNEAFVPLYHYLYVLKRRFNPREITQIVLQVLEAILYMQQDKDSVPDDVWTAWLSISPATLYVRLPTGRLGASSHWQPLIAAMAQDHQHTIEVKYAPVCYVQGGAVSRWRPHPRAASPACYALAQLLLGIYSRRVPYAKDWNFNCRLLTTPDDAALDPDALNEEETDECAAKEGVMAGIAVDPSLAPAGQELCRRALSLDRRKTPMTLQEFRDGLLLWEWQELHGDELP